jgi:methylmalonyl-CoA mutase N-terminal domain/subunit
VTDIFAYCQSALPNWNTISISGYHIREAGSTAVQELAFTFGNAITYVQAAIDRGLEFDSFAPRLSFFFNTHNDFLEEISKFRAARRIWARIAKERFGAKNPKSMMLRFHAQTAGSSLTAQQPDNNVVRIALQAFAAVLGGAQSLHTNSRDEALGLPTADAARLALRTQQIIAAETGVINTVDPVGGSYAVEALTGEIEERTLAYLKKIDDLGGMLPAIESGWVQSQIQEAAYAYQRSIESRERIVVGVNEYQMEDTTAVPIHTLDPQREREQIARLQSVRKKRNAMAVSSALEQLEAASRNDENLMPHILRAVDAYASVGEISDVFRKVHGEFREAVTI